MKCPMKYLMCTTLIPVDYKNIFYAARSYGQPHSFVSWPKDQVQFSIGQKVRSGNPKVCWPLGLAARVVR